MLKADKSTKHVSGLDGLRGVCALSVLMFHSGIVSTFMPNTYFLGPAAVVIFFVLSGLVLSIKPLQQLGEYKYLSYFGSRFIRLFIPVFAAIALTIVLDIVNHLTVNIPNDQSIFDGNILFNITQNFDVLLHLSSDGIVDTGLHPTSFVNTAVWSMPWEFLFSFLLPFYILIAYLLFGKKKHYGRRIVAIILTLLIIGFGYHISYFPIVYLPMFFLGVALAEIKFNRPWPKVLEIAICIVAVFCLEAQVLIPDFWLSIGLFDTSRVLFPIAAVLLVMLIKSGGIINNLFNLRLAKWLGKISFSLYLVHLPVFYVIRALFVVTGIASDNLLSFTAPLVAAFIGAVIFYKVIERPSHRLSRKVSEKLNAKLYDRV